MLHVPMTGREDMSEMLTLAPSSISASLFILSGSCTWLSIYPCIPQKCKILVEFEFRQLKFIYNYYIDRDPTL